VTDHAISWRISADEMAFGWADAPGMAICLEAGTRTPIAKLSYKLLGRDRLVIGELPHDVDESHLGATGAICSSSSSPRRRWVARCKSLVLASIPSWARHLADTTTGLV
jgi:hypothetical protein